MTEVEQVLAGERRWWIETGNALATLRALPDACVHMAVTSPPYFRQRDYGHPDQIGLEPTPQAFIAALVAVFAEVRRVLRDDGTFWLNIGDKYASKSSKTCKAKSRLGIPHRLVFALQEDGWLWRDECVWAKPNPMTESAKDRTSGDHEFVFLFAKKQRYFYDQTAVAVPAVTEDRPQRRRALELADAAGLTEDHFTAIRAVGLNDVGRAVATQSGAGKNSDRVKKLAEEAKNALGGYFREFLMDPTRNLRSVWCIPTESFRGAHFATFPAELPRRCIAAGTSAYGCCPACGAPWRRILEKHRKPTRPGVGSKCLAHSDGDMRTAESSGWNRPNVIGNRDPQRHVTATLTLGWEQTCQCSPAEAVPCRVLDPFSGAGTAILVATRLGRSAIGVEINPEYAEASRARLSGDSPLLDAPKADAIDLPLAVGGGPSLFDALEDHP